MYGLDAMIILLSIKRLVERPPSEWSGTLSIPTCLSKKKKRKIYLGSVITAHILTHHCQNWESEHSIPSVLAFGYILI